MNALLLSAAALVCVACHDCTEAAYDPDTTLRFEPALSGPGAYEVVLRAKDVEYTCDNTTYEGGVWACGYSSALGEEDSTGYASPAGTELWGVRVPIEAERFTVIVMKDGAELLTQEVRPTYEQDEPNGPGCGFRARGEAVVEVP